MEFDVTQNELLKLFEEETGSKFAVSHKTAEEAGKEGEAKLAIAGPDGTFPFEEFLQKYWFSDSHSHAYKESDKANSILQLPKTDLRDVIREYIREAVEIPL